MQGKMDARLQDAIDCGVSVDEVRVATQLCQRFLDKFKEPSGQAAHPLSLGEVADKVNVCAGSPGTCGQVSLGSSFALDLEYLDLGCMLWACEQLTKVHNVNPMLGVVVVSGDLTVYPITDHKVTDQYEHSTQTRLLGTCGQVVFQSSLASIDLHYRCITDPSLQLLLEVMLVQKVNDVGLPSCQYECVLMKGTLRCQTVRWRPMECMYEEQPG
jgi:hypothetical protein